MPGFSVDTHLLRELGELLVGRDSTALLELVKNAYDADASQVVIDAVGLSTPEGILRIVDDGNGMSKDRFETAFLRIASRVKEADDRRSPIYQRRYTGQKGIGRLAAHKLAAWLSVTSVPRTVANSTAGEVLADSTGVKAVLDWDLIEAQDDLEDLKRGLDVTAVPPLAGVPHGTALELRRPRSRWTDMQLSTFVREIRSAQPPQVLADPQSSLALAASPLLISQPRIRDARRNKDPGFQVRLTGELEVGDDLWHQASEEFDWLLEIDATTEVVHYQVTPLARYAAKEPYAQTYRFQRHVPLSGRPQFQARIFTMPNASVRRGPLTGFVRSNTGVRVYLEGFRVLPYGEYGDDWLNIDRDYRGGARFYSIDVDAATSDQVEIDKREALSATGNTGYVGAVFLTEDGAGGLRSLVNREGFVPDAVFDSLTDLVVTGIRLTVRVRRSIFLRVAERERMREEAMQAERQAAAHRQTSAETATQSEDKVDTSESGQDSRSATGPVAAEAQRELPGAAADGKSEKSAATQHTKPSDVLQPTIMKTQTRVVIEQTHQAVVNLRRATSATPDLVTIETIVTGFNAVESELARLRELQPDLRVLASVGLQLGAFVHDINGMLGQSSTVKELLAPLLADPTLDRQQQMRIRKVARALDDLTHTLARQSSYLTDVLVTDPRRRRSRILVADRLDVVRRLLSDQVARLEVVVEDDLPPDLKTPPMFPAEVGVMLTNLLTNAVKNAGSPGKVRISGELLGNRGATILVHNTGVAVDLEDSERWFLPFESTTVEVNDVLGQGLGLGLPITRALVEDYRGTIQFVAPPSGFATTIRVNLPDPQERR
ncbi:ATP-binding protein [Catellatospora sp. NPDC049133]|uniref:ATP-binding protein n=1 Tax=Catellatospora sp. NPDC049133 TaxID=3155499 RepID=UPI0033C82D31